MNKRIGVFCIVLLCLALISIKARAASSHVENPGEISKEEIIALIKEQGTKDNYYFEGLSYKLVNVDTDDDLEVIAQINGGVHLGDFFVLDKNTNGKYFLAAERDWNIEKFSIAGNIDYDKVYKLNESIERTGGSGLDIYIAHLWYLKEGKFVEAWKGTLKDRSFFQGNLQLIVGGYEYVEEFSKLFAWSSNYLVNVDTKTPIGKPSTTISIYKFDGSKFVPEYKEKYEHNRAFYNLQFTR